MKSRDGNATWDKTGNGSYRVRFYCDENFRREKKVRTITDRDALVRAIKRQEPLDYWYPEEKPESRALTGTFDALADLWMTNSKSVREVSESCLMNYRCHLKYHIRPVIGSIPAQSLNLTDIERVAELLKGKKAQTRSYVAVRQNHGEEDLLEDDGCLSQAYRREILVVACMVTKFGFERGYLGNNPFKEFKLPECPEQPYDYWRLDDEDKFFAWLEGGGKFYKIVGTPHSWMKGTNKKFRKLFRTRGANDLYDTVLFALRSGMRKGEIGALTSRDVNFGKNIVTIRRAYSTKEKKIKETTKSKTYRIVEMNEDMRQILSRRIEGVKSENETLFNVNTWAVKNFSKYCRKAEVREIHFHSLRHTCLTNLANGYGMDTPLPLPQVQKIAGHREIATTMRYVHVDGIENTNSRQWSRDERRSRSETNDTREMKQLGGGLRLVSGGRS